MRSFMKCKFWIGSFLAAMIFVSASQFISAEQRESMQNPLPQVLDEMQALGEKEEYSLLRADVLWRRIELYLASDEPIAAQKEKVAPLMAQLELLARKQEDVDARAEIIDVLLGTAVRLEDYENAFRLIDALEAAAQARNATMLAGQILAADKGKTFDVAARLEPLLKECAAQSDLIVVINAILGKYCALRGDAEKATQFFTAALETAKSLEAIEMQPLLGLIVSMQVTSEMFDAAEKVALAETLPMSQGILLTRIIIAILTPEDESSDKSAAAREAKVISYLEKITDQEARAVALATIIETIAAQKGTLSSDMWQKWFDLTDSEDVKALMATRGVRILLDTDRVDDALVLAAQANIPVLTDHVRLAQINALVRNKKWKEALECATEITDWDAVGEVLSGIIVAEYRAGNDAEMQEALSMLRSPAANTRSEELRASVAILAKATDLQSAPHRVDQLGSLFGQQFVLGDLEGSRTTLDTLLATLKTCPDAEKRFPILVQSSMMKIKLVRRTEIDALLKKLVDEIVAFGEIENEEKVSALLFCWEQLYDLIGKTESALPLETAITVAKTIEEPESRIRALVAIADVCQQTFGVQK